MKVIKRLTAWIVLSLSVQFLGFYYIDSKFLNIKSDVTVKKIEKIDNNKEIAEDIKASIAEDSEEVHLSHDGKYLSYIKEEDLYVENVNTKKTIKVELEDNSTMNYYKWLPDRDRILFVEKNVHYGDSNLKLYSYDVKKEEKVLINEFTVYDEKIKVSDIEVSTLTGLTYLKTVDCDNVSTIYRIDRMGESGKITTVPKYISNISILRTEDILYYEGEVYNKVYSSKNNEEVSIEGTDRLTLLGTDDNNTVYVGSIENGLITSIYYKTIVIEKENEENDIENNNELENDFNNNENIKEGSYEEEQFTQIRITTPAKREDMYATNDRGIYTHDKSNKTITNEINGKTTIYTGEFMEFRNDGIMINNGNEVSVVKYNK